MKSETGRGAIETPVLIIGGGPVGLALANELGWRGVDYLLADQGDGTVAFPASENVFSRTMEHLRRWGCADRARYQSAYPEDRKRNLIFSTSIFGRALVSLPGDSNADAKGSNAFSPEGPIFCPKMSFDPILLASARSHPAGTIRHHLRMTSFTQSADKVEAQLVDTSTGEEIDVVARYMVACDGAHGLVRQQLDIAYRGTFGQGYNFAVFFRSAQLDDRLVAHYGAPVVQLHTINVPGKPYLTTVNGRDLWRLSIYVAPGETPDPQDLLSNVLGSVEDCDILKAQPWTGHRVVAERYSEGRIFLAGDSAHLRWPKGGFGANTGIGDAVDIGWKLAAVVEGWGGQGLLDSYEAERRPIAVRNVNEASNNRAFDSLILPDPELDGEGDAADAARARQVNQLFLYRIREYLTDGIQLGYRYKGSPICTPDGDLEPPDDHMQYVPSTWAGSRAPHAWLQPGRSVLDLFGRGFVLLRFDRGADTGSLVRAAESAGVPLEIVDLADRDIETLYERKLVLVRPDGHVAWRDDIPPENAAALIARVTGRRTVPCIHCSEHVNQQQASEAL